MAKMKLYYSPGSPYARKVRIVAMETKLDKKMEMVNVAVSPIAPNADARAATAGWRFASRRWPTACSTPRY